MPQLGFFLMTSKPLKPTAIFIDGIPEVLLPLTFQQLPENVKIIFENSPDKDFHFGSTSGSFITFNNQFNVDLHFPMSDTEWSWEISFFFVRDLNPNPTIHTRDNANFPLNPSLQFTVNLL